MIPLDLHSERFARTGNIAGEGFRRLLGRPALGLLQTVIREALQNSVDAAPEGNRVEILLRFRTLEGDALARLRDLFFRALPPEEADAASEEDESASLRDILRADQVSLLEIADFNTSGLAGPTRADVTAGEEALDFVNFLRNVGAARDTHHGGGTYGYASTPATRPEFWQAKFAANVMRDLRNEEALLEQGWKVAVVWECGLSPRVRDGTIKGLVAFIRRPASPPIRSSFPETPPRPI